MKQALALLSLSALLFTGACGESGNPLLAPQPEAPSFSTSTSPTVSTVDDPTVRCSSIGYGTGYLASKYQLGSQGFHYDYSPAEHDLFKVSRTGTGKFNWSAQKSGVVVSAVIGKQTGGTVFEYAPPVSSGSGWSTENRETSHVELCFQYELQMSATAATSYERTYGWSIAKTASESQLTLAQGQAAPVSVDYQITLGHDAGTDAKHAVTGGVEITNPAHFAVTLTGVDAPAGVIVDCGTFPRSVAGGAKLSCTYSAARTNGDAGSYTFVARTSTSGVRAGSKTVGFTFGAPTTLKDSCVDIGDNLAGPQGTKCVGASSLVIGYSRSFAAADYQCGPNAVVNTASYTTDSSGSTGSASHTLNIELTCAASSFQMGGVCTLSQGYWKNHGDPRAKRYDARWANVGGRGASFFGHDKHSWISIWNTAPAGNAYYTLAHQYMAAKLNVLGGAKAPAPVEDAIARAEAFFRANRPGARLSGAARTNAKSWAATLEAFNSRAPYHCSE